MNYWLLKSEPNVYSIDDLQRDGHTCWEGVRNYSARNNMRKMAMGDLALFYHSNANCRDPVAQHYRQHWRWRLGRCARRQRAGRRKRPVFLGGVHPGALFFPLAGEPFGVRVLLGSPPPAGVPDGGTTLGMLGLAGAGLLGLRRKLAD